MGSWRESTRKALVGPEVRLKTTGGECWIKPKKLSQKASDEIGELQRSLYNTGDNRRRIKEYRELAARLEAEGKSIDDVDPLELMAVVPQTESGYRTSVYKLAFSDGIGAHNFVDDDGALIGEGKRFDEKTIEEILEWGPLAEEIFTIVQEYNRPLALRSEPSSAT